MWDDLTYMVLEVFARSQAEAFHMANWKVELFRSLLNFTFSFGRITRSFGRPKPLARISPSRYIFVFDNERRFLNCWETVTEPRYYNEVLNRTELEVIGKNIASFERLRHNKLRGILTECLSLYGYALDQIENGYTFLHLWQILESIALKEKGGISFDKMKRRIRSVFMGNRTVSDTVDALFDKRNQLVHEGRISDFDTQDVHQIKGLTEVCIKILWSHVNGLDNTENLQGFYESIMLDKDRIGKKIRILNYVKGIQESI